MDKGLKKEIVILILIIIVLMGAVYLLEFNRLSKININDKNGSVINGSVNPALECNTDSDCIKVQTSCCSCKMGGTDICVPLKEKEKYEVNGSSCGRIICPAIYNCKIESCSCRNNKCTEA